MSIQTFLPRLNRFCFARNIEKLPSKCKSTANINPISIDLRLTMKCSITAVKAKCIIQTIVRSLTYPPNIYQRYFAISEDFESNTATVHASPTPNPRLISIATLTRLDGPRVLPTNFNLAANVAGSIRIVRPPQADRQCGIFDSLLC